MTRHLRMLFLVSGIGFALILFLLLGCSRPTPREISVTFVGVTNGIVGITNGSWTVYCVSNHTKDSFSYAGTKMELKTDNGWAMDPDLKPTEVGGWLAPPTKIWHDGSGTLSGAGSFHIFFNISGRSVPWRASLRFLRNGTSAVPTSLRTNPAAPAAVVEAAVSVLDYSRPYDCPVPDPGR